MRDSGFSEETIVPISYDTRNWTNEVNRQAMVEILSGDSRPDALMLLDDFQLPGVISAFNALGLRTPGDILICVWHNSGAKDPDISCMVMEVDTDAIAYGLCAQLDHLLAGRGVPQQTLVRGHLRLVGNI